MQNNVTKPSSQVVVSANHLTMRYGEFQALSDFSLNLKSGEIVGLLGPNGAGKTTFIKICVGLSKPTSGKLSLFGESPYKDRKIRSEIGFMPQNHAVYPDLTVIENVRFFSKICGRREITDRSIADTIQAVALEKFEQRKASTLSGGMLRRLSLAIAIIGNPRLLVLDEPTAGVDPQLRLNLWDVFRARANAGATVLVTTHHIAEASRADRVLFIRNGLLLDHGSPDELLGRYKAVDLEQAFLHAMTGIST